MNKIKLKLLKILDWLNGFAFRFFTIIFGAIIISIFSFLLLIAATIGSICWIFIGKEKSLKEIKALETK